MAHPVGQFHPANRPLPPLAASDLDLVLEHTAPLWDAVRHSRIFLTGGTGFFGCWLVESFCHINRALQLGTQLVVLTRNPAAFAEKCPHLAADPAVTLHAGDVRHGDFPAGAFDFVIHAATATDARFNEADPLDAFSTIVGGTEHVLEFAAARGAVHFLLTSSGAVYGRQPPGLTRVPETFTGGPDPLAPANVYHEGKRAAEMLCALHAQKSGLACAIARGWTFVGPHLPLHLHFAIGNFIGDVLAGRPIRIQGDGSPRRSYLYTADLAIWLWTMLFRAPSLVPINVGSSHDFSILELAQTVAAVLRPETEIQVARMPDPKAAPLRYVPSVERARELLGLAQTVSLEESILRTAAWHRSFGS
jgi:nucleoside-diphosphate-sugar epimerase